MNLNDYLMSGHDTMMFYGGILAIILNIGCFLLMHFVPTKKKDPYKFLMKWGRPVDAFIPFCMGLMTESRNIAGDGAIVTRGLCRFLENPWCGRLNFAITLALNNILFGIIFTTGLMRYNVSIRETAIFKTTLLEKFYLFIIVVVSPVALLATSYNLIVVDDNFIHKAKRTV
uniref:G_PROTEIN_RECEP_F1_2 domain-containing protein n=1 Tax=Rhabditophanes sp. KR3021 TaxID=114890 RepID=A0AC35UAC5_9BILA